MCKRGEVYYIRYNDAIGAEQFVGRPGIIVSSDTVNEHSATVMIVYTSAQYRNYWFNPELTSTTKRSWALCEQITTVDKMRLGDRMCKLTDDEMAAIDDVLTGLLGLDYPAEEPEPEEPEAEDDFSWRVEAECYKRLYEKALEKLVERRYAEK